MFTALSVFFAAGPYLCHSIIIQTHSGVRALQTNAHRTGTRRAIDFAPETPRTANSPSRLVLPYKLSGFVVDEGVYGGEVPSNTYSIGRRSSAMTMCPVAIEGKGTCLWRCTQA